LEALEKKKDLCKRLGSHGIYSKRMNIKGIQRKRDFKSKTAFVVYSPRTGVYFCIKMAFS
jgi:hypothetical protein